MLGVNPGSEQANVRTRRVEEMAMVQDCVERVDGAAGVGEKGNMWDGEGFEEKGEGKKVRGDAGREGSRCAAAKARAIHCDKADVEFREEVVKSEDRVAASHQPTQEDYYSACVGGWVGG